jgi:hypothetical protein
MMNKPLPDAPGSTGEIKGVLSAKTKVVVCTSDYTFSGYINRVSQQRTLDVLNKGVVTGQPQSSRDFLQITEAEILTPSGQKREESATCYIGKRHIVCVLEKTESQKVVDTAKARPKVYPFREKKPLCVKIYIPLHVLSGNVHVEVWQNLQHVLEGDEDFVAVTDVEITPHLVTGDLKANFVAVNKAHVTFVEEA